MRAVADESWENVPGNQNGPGERLYVRFHLHPVEDAEASGLEGRPIFKDVEYVEIAVPGDKQSVVDRAVRAEDRMRFNHQYRAWKAGDEDALSGTPLAEWPLVTRSQVEELKYFKVRTVEQLAALSDGNLQHVGPIRALRQKAVDYLEAAKKNAPLVQMRAALAERDNQIATMQQQLKELGDRVDSKKKSAS